MQVEVVLMDLFVQIDLPPYTDYASLEQMLTLAIECVSLIAISHYIEHIFSVGRMLDSVNSREYLIHLGCLPISYTVSLPDVRLPFTSPVSTFSACLASSP